MASGEHVVEDLFGFAELTGESTAPSVDKKPDDAQKFHFEKEKIKRDTNEVVVPMFFEKSGMKKYKVLARHQVEDDEDIKRPDSLERESPNSEEQRKENICVDRRSEKSQKYKTVAIGLFKKTKVKRIEKRKEKSIKDFKKCLNTSNFKGEYSKVNPVKSNGKRNKNDKQKVKKLESSTGKHPKAFNYEFNEDSDSNSELQMKSSSENKADNESCDNSCARKSENGSEKSNLEKRQVVQNPLKIKCHVKLRRDPSIENFYKAKPDNDSKDLVDPELSDRGSKHDEESDIIMKAECFDDRSSSPEVKSLCGQGNSEDNLMKAADMVYNVDIRVRKSGRLQSAKCASRYRGDYGIRVDTYKQLINKSATSSNDSFETDEKMIGNGEGSEPVTEHNIENQAIIQSKDLSSENILEKESDKKGFTTEESRNEIVLKNEHTESKVNAAELHNENINPNDLSDNFTVIKTTCTDYCSFGKNSCIHADGVTDSLNEIFIDKGYENCQKESGLKQESDKIQLSDNNKSDEVQSVTSEILKKTCDVVTNRPIQTQICDLNMNSGKGTTHTDSCRCEVTETRKTKFAQYESKVIQTECNEVASKVPCSDMFEGIKICTCDNRQDNFSQCMNDVDDKIDIDNVTCKAKNEVITSQVNEIEKKQLSESQNIIGNVDESVELIQTKSKYSDRRHSTYVHSVGKSVNKMQNRIRGKKPVVELSSDLTEKDISPECSPVKDSAKTLEYLRQKLFESAGANLVEADKATKQFESKLISSKQRQSMTVSNFTETVNLQDREKQVRDSDSASTKSGKSTPRCTTPRQEAGREILEEVAKSLNVLHQAKRRSENVRTIAPTKRQRFEDKKFMLRSMIRTSDNVTPTEATQLEPDVLITDNNCNEKPVFVGRIAERTRSSRGSCESSGSATEMYKLKVESNLKMNDVKLEKRNVEQDKINPKLKPVKCSACGHIFKTKDLLRKHFPCRIRQTRTWSQNKLRPNRAVKRNEHGSKKFVCKLPKAGKSEPNKSRPQLLTYRKTKFRRVKGKRRRKLYQLIQELKQKRNPAKWHHLSILYDDLSFKEQCLYKLGLICIGNAAEGLERYTAEDITVFEQHRAKEKWLKDDARTFVHSIPDTLKPLTDLNVSTELSTDTQESDFFSPKHVINFPQEEFPSKICDNVIITQEEKDGARNQSVVNTYENCSEELTIISQSKTRGNNEHYSAHNYLIYPGIQEQEAEASFEEIGEIKTPGTLHATMNFQECHGVFKSSTPQIDIKNDVAGKKSDASTSVEDIRSLKEARIEMFTSVSESNTYLEVVKELSPVNTEVMLKNCIVENPFEKVDISEIDIEDAYEIDANETNIHEPFDKSQDKNTICQQIVLEENSDGESGFIDEHLNTDLPLTMHVYDKEKNDSQFGFSEKISSCSISSPGCLVKEKEDLECKVLYSEERMSKNEEKLTREQVFVTKDVHIDTQNSNEEFVSLSVHNFDKDEFMKKTSPRNKCLAGPDIELYHQTAILDDQFLTAAPQSIQREAASDNEIIKSSNTSESYKGDGSSDVFIQASGILNDIIGNIEERTNESKDKLAHEIVNAEDIDRKNLNAEDISPIKGILKNTCPKKKYEAGANFKYSNELSLEEPNAKSPKKKKIDFKTYAKRKGLIRDSDTKNKESVQSELHHHENKVNELKTDSDDNDKECMRSEPSVEIEDGLLGRLLDAVNLIDSIIEEHKEETDLEENSDTFSAITPEMAFEALVANKNAVTNNFENFVSKPYDIESVYSYTEADEKDFSQENLRFTDVSEISKCDFNEFTYLDRDPACLISNRNISAATENIKGENLSGAYSATMEDFDKIKGTTSQNRNSESDHLVCDIEIHKEYDRDDIDEIGKKFCKEAELLTVKELNVDYENSQVPESEMMIKEPEIIENNIMSSVERPEDTMCQIKTFGKAGEKYDITDSSVKQNEIETIQLNSNKDVEQNVTNFNQTLFEKEKYILEQDNVHDKTDVENTYFKEKVHESIDIEKTEIHEIMKSPDRIPKKGLNKVNENAAIKESKKDFTIKYEMNGIVVKENLLTGDKNVVENSSPFRSSAESESNCDHSSLSELDISSNIDNDVSFDSSFLFEEDSDVKDTIKSYENVKSDSSLIIENEAERNSTIMDCQLLSTEENCCDQKQMNEQPNHMEKERMTLSLDKHSEVSILLKNDITFDKEDHSVPNKKAMYTMDLPVGKNNVDLPVETVPEMQPNLSGQFVQDVSSEIVMDKPLVNEKCKFIKKLSEDRSVGSPPVLEKVEVSEESMDEEDDTTSSPETEISIEGEPPLLEPQHFEENSGKVIAAKSQHSEDTTKSSDLDINKVKQDTIVKQERHFLDILSIVGTEAKDANVFASFGKKFEENGLQQSDKTHNKEPYKEDPTFNEDISIQFSDVMSEPVEIPKSPKSKLQFLFDNSESGDISFAQIKDVLSPFSVKGKKKSISKESLLKIKCSIADLLLNAENPVQKDPKWLKSDPFSDCTGSNNSQKKSGFEGDDSETESLCDKSNEVDIFLDGSEPEQYNAKIKCTKSSVADHILEMLNSLEDKGNIAENMSNLLGILAENLGFLGKRKVEDLSSDSDYSYNEDTNLTGNSSTENTQKELIAEYLEEGEQPPSLEDIPTAGNLEIRDVIGCIKDNEEDEVSNILVYEQSVDKHAVGKRDSFTDISKQKCNRKTEEEVISQMECKQINREIDSDTHMNETKMDAILKDRLNFESSEDSLSLSCDHTKSEKHKATTIFKSITELNSIETDEESVTDEPFDPVSMSARLSDLKVLSKDNNRWEFNSDYNSDDDKLDYYDSDYENDIETPTGIVVEGMSSVSDKIRVNTNNLEEIESAITNDIIKQSTDIFENQDICSDKNEGDSLDVGISTNNRNKSDLLTLTVISKDSSKLDAMFNDGKETIKDTGTLTPVLSKNAEHKTDISQLSTIFSLSNTCDDESNSERPENIDNATPNTFNTFKKYESDLSRPKDISSEPTLTKFRADNIFTSLVHDIEKTETVYCFDDGKQEHDLGYTDEFDDKENIDSQSLKAVQDPFSDNEKDISEDESWENDIYQDDIVTMESKIGASDQAIEIKDTDLGDTSLPVKENDKSPNDKNTLDCNGVDDDLKLILEVDPSIECPLLSKERNGSIDLQTDKSSVDNEYNHKQTTSSNDSLLYKVDEDTTDTVNYEENLDAATDFCDNTYQLNKDNEQTDNMKVKEDLKNLLTVEHDSISTLSQVALVDKNETEVDVVSSDNTSSLIKVNGSESCRQKQDFGKTDTFIYQQSTEVVSDEDEHTNKRRSTSLNIHDDYTDNFCESIAEKVKRKQRERSKSVCYNFNPWLYYSAAYVREVTKPAKKEFSVFRSSILEKRAREKSFSPDKDFDSSTRKKRNSSVPKEAKYTSILKNDRTKEKRIVHAQQPEFQIKPCSVLIPKLKEDVILKYTRRKRKCEEDTTESRPPIKVTIKLSQILYPPPNSPYGSTSASSDNYRSGYESCSEESETDSVYAAIGEKELVPYLGMVENLKDGHIDNERNKTAEVICSEPLKIKIRTFRSKDEECQKLIDSVQKNNQVEHVVERLGDSTNKFNIESSSNGFDEELTESEVLLDIKRECDKMKSSKSTEENVMFYISDSDSDNEQKISEHQNLQNKSKEKQDIFGPRMFSKSSVQAECGESDVDLSDSDTDSEIQEAIDKILNSKSSSDFSSEMVKDAENNKQSALKKGSGSIMKMIVSKLQLSESESESEYEKERSEEFIKAKGNNIVQENGQQEELHYPTEKDFQPEDTLSQDEVFSVTNVTGKKVLLRIEDECINKEQAEKNRVKFQENSNLNVTGKCSETKIAQEGETNLNHFSGIDSLSKVTDSCILKSGYVITSNETAQPSKQNDKESSILHVSSLIHVEEHIDEDEDPILSNTEYVSDHSDLSVTLKNNKQISTGISCEEAKGKTSSERESEFLGEKKIKPYSNFKSTDINLNSDNHNSKKRALTHSETSNENESLNTIVERDSKKPKLNDVRTDVSENDHTNTDRADSNELSLSDNVDNIDDCHQQKRDEVTNDIESITDLRNAIDNENMCLQRDHINFDIGCQGSTDNGNGKSRGKSEDVSKNYQASEEDMVKTEISEEDSKQLENDSAVKNLEEDTFRDVQAIHDTTEDEIVYYAVELSDDLETSEAVVNLETVELIEGPIIVENNETREENVIDTNIIQSHINDQFELSNETLNEQVVEILNEPKISEESRINCALEDMPQMEHATVDDIKSKYLYGINEDSQSSTEVVEELVTEIVNDNTVIDTGHESENNQPSFSTEVTSWENLNGSSQFLDIVQKENNNFQSVLGHDKNDIMNVIPTCAENEEVVSECSIEDQHSRNGLEGIQNAKFVSEQSSNSENDEHDPDLLMAHMKTRLINETDEAFDNLMIIDKEVMKTDYNLDTEDLSHCSQFVDNYTSPLNISIDCSDTRDLCSGQGSFVQLKSNKLSHGNDLISAESCANEYSDNNSSIMCVEPSHILEDRCSGISEGNNILQEFDNYEDSAMILEPSDMILEPSENIDSAMIIEHNEENDYIITQNVSIDDENDDDDNDEMETH